MVKGNFTCTQRMQVSDFSNFDRGDKKGYLHNAHAEGA